MSETQMIPLPDYREYDKDKMIERARSFFEDMSRRRTVREFADRDVPKEVIQHCIRAAGRAPNGANRQPWHFAVVEDDQVKSEIRAAAEEEEKAFYENRATDEWLDALEPLGTDWQKPFLETAPYLIVIFEQQYKIDDEGNKQKNYYTRESVGIATGILITALHRAGLVSLTHTPSPMGFLTDILDRPDNERPYLNLVTGYPSEDATVPDIDKKSLEEISSWI